MKRFLLGIPLFFILLVSRTIEIFFLIVMCIFWIFICAFQGKVALSKKLAKYSAQLYRSTRTKEELETPTKKNIKKLRRKYGW